MNISKIITRIWKDNVGGSLIATGIVALLTSLVVLIKSLIAGITFSAEIKRIYLFLSTLTNNKIFIVFMIIVILLTLIVIVRFLMKTANPIIDKIISNKLPKTGLSSTALFSQRIADAFPGNRGIVWYNNPKDALKRLMILLKDPLKFEAVGDATSEPIWCFRDNSSASILKFTKLSKTKGLMDFTELEIERIAVNVSTSYYKSFVYVECKAEKQTGLYKITSEKIEEFIDDFGYCWEEYGLYKRQKVTRQEYDDNSAMIKGKVVSIAGAQLRVRYLSKYNFIITAKGSPYNSRKFNLQAKTYFNGILNNSITPEEFFEFLNTFQKDER